jgi:hypothetical protein
MKGSTFIINIFCKVSRYLGLNPFSEARNIGQRIGTHEILDYRIVLVLRFHPSARNSSNA